jgi:uncharacterized membrane protein
VAHVSDRLEGAPVGAAVDPVSATGELAATGPAVRRHVSPMLIPGWLMAGLRDFMRAPLPSLLVGGACVLLSWMLSVALLFTEYGVLILPMTAGFMFAAPLLAIGLYEASRRHETGEAVGLGATRAAWRRNRFGIAFMAALLMMFLYGWLRVATMLFALFFGLELPPLGNFLQTAFFTAEHRDFALLGTAIGAVLASIVFGLSAFSLPMLVDRPVDPVTAAATSMRACLANPLTALLWAATIVGVTLVAAVPAFLGFAVVLPVLGHATWHAYRALVAPAEG